MPVKPADRKANIKRLVLYGATIDDELLRPFARLNAHHSLAGVLASSDLLDSDPHWVAST
jgi:hypothetical protein